MNDARLKRDAQKYRGVADLDSDFAEMQALWNTALERAVDAHSQVDGEVNNENVGGDRFTFEDFFPLTKRMKKVEDKVPLLPTPIKKV